MINALECNTFEKARQWQIEWEQERKKEKDNHSRQDKTADTLKGCVIIDGKEIKSKSALAIEMNKYMMRLLKEKVENDR